MEVVIFAATGGKANLARGRDGGAKGGQYSKLKACGVGEKVPNRQKHGGQSLAVSVHVGTGYAWCMWGPGRTKAHKGDRTESEEAACTVC